MTPQLFKEIEEHDLRYPIDNPTYVEATELATKMRGLASGLTALVNTLRITNPQALTTRFVEVDDALGELLERLCALSPKERSAYMAVIMHPGSKQYLESNEKGEANWIRLQEMGLVRACGSYKWVPTEVGDLMKALTGGVTHVVQKDHEL